MNNIFIFVVVYFEKEPNQTMNYFGRPTRMVGMFENVVFRLKSNIRPEFRRFPRAWTQYNLQRNQYEDHCGDFAGKLLNLGAHLSVARFPVWSLSCVGSVEFQGSLYPHPAYTEL